METETNPDIFNPHRYQLSKHASYAVKHGLPWIFRSNLSSAIDVFGSGQHLFLVDGDNKNLGFGVFDKHGKIGIRVFSYEHDQSISEDFFTKKIMEWFSMKLKHLILSLVILIFLISSCANQPKQPVCIAAGFRLDLYLQCTYSLSPKLLLNSRLLKQMYHPLPEKAEFR